MKHLTRAALLGTLSLAASGAFAQKTGDWLANVGYAYVSPGAKLSSISSTEPFANGALQGSSAKIANVDTLQFGAAYMLSDNWSAELSLGIPPKFSIGLTVPAGDHPNAITTRALMPVLSAKYLFGSASSDLRPFAGLGVSYVAFTDNQYNAADPTVGALASQSISIKSSWAPVVTLGASYKLSDNWYINGSASYLPIKVDATLDGPGVGAGATTTSSSFKMDTTIFLLSLSYKF